MGNRGVLAVLALLVAGCAAGTLPPVPAAPLRLRAEVDRAEVTIYDPVTLTMHVDYAEGVVPELPDGPPPMEGLTLTDAREAGPTLANGRTALTRTYVVHAEHAGSYIIPGITLPYTLPDGTRAEATTARLFLNVRATLEEGGVDLAALRPIKPPVAIPRDYTPLLLVALGILVGLVLAFLLFRWWLQRRTARAAEAAPPLPPHEAALNALAMLERGTLLDQDRVREYVYELTEIFRAYLEGRFGIPAVASTSEQLLPVIRNTPSLPGDTATLAQRFAAEADPIKFAGAHAGTELARTWTADVRRYVETTAPRPELQEAA